MTNSQDVEFKPGLLLFDYDNESYHAAPGLSSSAVRCFYQQSAKHYHYYYVLQEAKKKETQALFLGSLVHSLILEPDSFYQKYRQEFNKDDYPNALNTVADLKDYCQQHGLSTDGLKPELIERVLAYDSNVLILSLINAQNEHNNRRVIKNDMWDKCHSMRDSVLNHPDISKLFNKGHSEVSVWGQHADTELLTKCRCDWLRNDGLVIDLKTSIDGSQDGFAKECAKYNYALQQVHYMNTLASAGYPKTDFLFVVVEKEPPYVCQCYALDKHSVLMTEHAYQKTMQNIRRCHNDNNWPPYTDDTQLSLPLWKLNEMDCRYA